MTSDTSRETEKPPERPQCVAWPIKWAACCEVKNDTLWGARQVVSSQEAANVTFSSTQGVPLSLSCLCINHPFHAARSNVLQLDPLEILALATKSVELSKVSRVSCALCLLTEETCKLKWAGNWKSAVKAWTRAWRKRTSGQMPFGRDCGDGCTTPNTAFSRGAHCQDVTRTRIWVVLSPACAFPGVKDVLLLQAVQWGRVSFAFHRHLSPVSARMQRHGADEPTTSRILFPSSSLIVVLSCQIPQYCFPVTFAVNQRLQGRLDRSSCSAAAVGSSQLY